MFYPKRKEVCFQFKTEPRPNCESPCKFCLGYTFLVFLQFYLQIKCSQSKFCNQYSQTAVEVALLGKFATVRQQITQILFTNRNFQNFFCLIYLLRLVCLKKICFCQSQNHLLLLDTTGFQVLKSNCTLRLNFSNKSIQLANQKKNQCLETNRVNTAEHAFFQCICDILILLI